MTETKEMNEAGKDIMTEERARKILTQVIPEEVDPSTYCRAHGYIERVNQERNGNGRNGEDEPQVPGPEAA